LLFVYCILRVAGIEAGGSERSECSWGLGLRSFGDPCRIASG
jgi:hypothetical protein